jgi:hypothetical protein
MDSNTKDGLDQLADRIYDAGEKIVALLDEEDLDVYAAEAIHDAIAEISAQYKELAAQVADHELMKVERKYERKLIDLRRKAGKLPDKREGRNPVTDETQGIGVINSRAPRQIASRDRLNMGGLKVGADIDGWCGPCDSLRVHSIVAMVGDQVKQVVCSMCNSRHGHRMTPARSKSKDGQPAASIKEKQTNTSVKASQAEQKRMALQQELTDATNVREFALRARYKAGEIIEHNKYGRGKVENVLRDSILVRFRTGLRPLNTF